MPVAAEKTQIYEITVPKLTPILQPRAAPL
jgi:hypothetical protein